MALIINWLIDDAKFFSASPMIWQCKLDNLGCQRIGNGRSVGNVNWQVSINGHSFGSRKLQFFPWLQPHPVIPCYTVVIVGLITAATVTSCCESHLQLAESSPTKFLGRSPMVLSDHGKQTMSTRIFITT
jgi:hypothetical protein